MSGMRWVSGLSREPSFEAAVAAVADQIAAQIPAPDLLIAFVSPHHGGAWNRLPERLRTRFSDAALVGCSGGGIIGGAGSPREIERAPALSVTAAALPDVEIRTFRAPSTGGLPVDWSEVIGLVPEQQPCFIVLPDPLTCQPGPLLQSLDRAFPGCPKIGGLASGGAQPGQHRLFLDDEALTRGAVGAALYGDVVMDSVVAQGARPIGRPLRVSDAHRNLLLALDGAPALDALDQIFSALEPAERARFQRAPMVGIAMNRDDRQPGPGDFLVRDVVGLDRAQKIVGVNALVEAGQQIQFHLRDASAAAQELDALLGNYTRGLRGAQPAGALLFSCLGRGQGFYGAPDHDTEKLAAHLGEIATGGFFCNGEIGPVHAETWLHAYTSAFGLFRPRGWS